ncbi:bile acid:sodium symporter family protein [Fulvivirgaceae bacterium BMA10]|uniref:Bile acid:sodium symporter family protein n=1 Tax=Splendidivirga corallicola TaxID=3051826 RepID=A0ABT8L0G7_9BACT|nr:bile acid:sodium symporter family protein [Fulvivirgaceae bacterium BMA10]
MDNSSAYILFAALFIIMFGMGLSLTIEDFKRVVTFPKAAITGLFNQMILLPIIGFLLASFMQVAPVISVGIMLLAACPGGATSNLITHLAKGDTALSITLTAITSIATIFTIPFIVQWSMVAFLQQEQQLVLDIPSIMLQLLMITLIPVSLGMLINAKATSFAKKMDKPTKIASAVVFALVLVGVILKERDNVVPFFQQAGFIALLLNLLTMGTAMISARVMRLPKRQAISIAIESGIQNGTLAITIATVTLGDSQLSIAPAIYGLIMFVTSIGVIVWSIRR